MKLQLEDTLKLSKFFLAIAAALLGLQDRAQAINFSGTTSGEWGLPLISSPTSAISITSHNGGTNNHNPRYLKSLKKPYIKIR
ncbi:MULTISPECIES: hypothetical protein [Aerosakkonema]|uniref:hypothetical protein n=1 Tax=Aerosakkonema TaxID=1246629 RepID=UPI0035B9F0CD